MVHPVLLLESLLQIARNWNCLFDQTMEHIHIMLLLIILEKELVGVGGVRKNSELKRV